MIKAVLFDVDGTIIESKDLLLKAFNLALIDIGEEPVDEKIYEISKDKQLGTITHHVVDVLGKPEKKAAMYAAHMKHYTEILRNEVELIPGTREVFGKLRESGIKIGIHTMQYRAMIDIVLNKFELGVDSSVAYEEVENRKPAPDQVLKLCGIFGVEAQEAVVVGDWVGDMEAGKAAGAETIGVLTGLNSEEELVAAGADIVLEDINGVPGIVLKTSSETDSD